MKNIFLVFSVILMFYHQSSGYSSEDNVKGSTEFSFDLYRTLYDQSTNLVVSPYSLRIILGILYQSSHGSAHAELKDKVYFGEKLSTLATYKSAIDHFTSSPNVKMANKLYLGQGLTLKPNFKTVVTEFKSETEVVNFIESDQVANNMNQWVEEHTNGLIKNLVNPDMMTPDTVLFIINTLYFKAKWQYEFPTYSVRKEPFHGYHMESSIDFMNNEDRYGYIKSDEHKVEVVEIAYTKDSNFVFWILLPFQDSNLEELKSHLNYDFINNISSNMHHDDVVLYMPLFEIESSIDGTEVLQKMGIQTIFHDGQMEILDNDTPVSVSDVRQKAKITVNTEGTEAAAASFGKLVAISARYPNPPVVRVDRPFIYMIMTAHTKEPVFVGHFVKP